jgi:hypothetical protein
MAPDFDAEFRHHDKTLLGYIYCGSQMYDDFKFAVRSVSGALMKAISASVVERVGAT